MFRLPVRWLLLGGLVSFQAVSAGATVAVPLTFERLTAEADLVVQGAVLEQKSFLGPNKERVYTHTRVLVLRTLKGKTDERILTVRQWGGAVGALRMVVPGNASLKEGEEVVLFLSREAPHHFVVGLAQGKFTLQADASGRKIASRDLSGITFARWSQNGKFSLSKRWELDRPLTLDDLESAVKRALSAPAGAAR
jgi:hypothetical protein